jgi:hypothetical protein
MVSWGGFLSTSHRACAGAGGKYLPVALLAERELSPPGEPRVAWCRLRDRGRRRQPRAALLHHSDGPHYTSLVMIHTI